MSDISEQPVKILLVEDSEFDVQQIFRALRDRRVRNEVIHFDNAEDAWAYLLTNSEEVGLLLLDLNLPVMSGHELLQQIRAHDRLASLLVVILTTSDRDEDIVRSFGNHAQGYVQKPFEVDNLLEHFCQQPNTGIQLVQKGLNSPRSGAV